MLLSKQGVRCAAHCAAVLLKRGWCAMLGEEREQCLPVSLIKDIGSGYGNFKVSVLVKD